MPVANKVGQKFKNFILRSFSEKHNRRLTRVVKIFILNNFLNNFVFQCLKKLFQGIKCMASSALESRKEITCTSNFSKFSKKKKERKKK